jgi:hypothetical protein
MEREPLQDVAFGVSAGVDGDPDNVHPRGFRSEVGERRVDL